MKCAFLGTKIAASFETAKRILLKSVKEFEKVRYSLANKPSPQLSLRTIAKSSTMKSYPTCFWRKRQGCLYRLGEGLENHLNL